MGDALTGSFNESASSDGTRGYAKGRARRAEIIARALEAFSVEGYRSSSVVQIAAACGVSRAGLLHYFPTKESLLTAVLEERDRVDQERFFGAGVGALDGAEVMRRLVRLVDHNASNVGIVRLFVVLSAEATDASHPAHDFFARRYQRVRGLLAAAIAELASSGGLRPGVAADGLATELVALIDGLQVQWLFDPSSVDMGARLRARMSEVLTVEID